MVSDKMENKIQAAYNASKNYPELVKALIQIGVESYTVEVSSSTILYRFEGGENSLHTPEGPLREIAEKFSKEGTLQAVRDNQQGKTTYPGFMDAIALAGVRFYEATLNGDKKRVTYIGKEDYYEELIPV